MSSKAEVTVKTPCSLATWVGSEVGPLACETGALTSESSLHHLTLCSLRQHLSLVWNSVD